ncbi:hypothetical protein ETU08_08180 [Apibacter muscae]|uniref:hypothetical protein n=1 Tax=Apibacter muscae TaxID=2509004 RepID=UPI0011ACB2CE|nr:hypothetical protein [Apibacter muscae]TWP28920.1 hypothetical protein ETU08_08180 [Apibacter muscae]
MPGGDEDKCIEIGINCPPPQKQDGGLKGTSDGNQKRQDIINRRHGQYSWEVDGHTNKESKIIIKVVDEPIQAWVAENPDTKVNALVVGYKKGKKDYFDVNSYGMVELPADNPNALNGQYTFDKKVIYEFYQRNDVPNRVKDQWGKAEYIANMINSILEYNKTYSDIISIGDMRSPSDGPTYASSSKTHHANSGAFDIRFLGKNGTIKGGGTPSQVNLEKTQFFMDCLGKHSFTRIILSHKLKNKGFKVSGTLGILWDPSTVHDNHYHVDMGTKFSLKPE